MNYASAAAISNNIAGIGEMFMQMNDPAARAKAALVGNQNALLGAQVQGQAIENQYRPALFGAQTQAYNANAQQSVAGAFKANAEGQHWTGRNVGQQRMLDAAAPPQAGNYSIGADGVVTPETESQIWGNATPYLTNPSADRSKLPLGMRNNNPLNIVYPSAEYARRVGAIGASANHDSGSSDGKGGKYRQLVFADPVAGMRAAADLIDRKYGGGMKTANQIIAGEQGWTGGNFAAAANVARTMGVSPDADLNLSDPATKIKFMKALALQEHGAASALYTDEVYGGRAAPQQPTMNAADMQRLAINTAISADSNPSDMMTGIARASALFGATEQGLGNAATAISGNLPGQGEYGITANRDAFQARDLANNLAQEQIEQQGAMQRTVADNDLKARTSIFEAAVGGVSGAGSSSTGSRGKFDAFDGAKEISTSAVSRFSLDGETVGQADLPKAQAWATSVSTLATAGIPFETAKSIADAHHGLPTMEDGVFSSPHQSYDNFKATSITPEQAAQAATRYLTAGTGGGNMDRIMGAAQIFGFGGQPTAAAAPAAQPASTPPAATPQTGTDKPPGKALGAEREKADKQKGMDEGTAYNSATLGNIMRAAKAEGVPFDDILATVAAGGESNDQEISRIFTTSKGLGIRLEGGHAANDLRNALKDGRALKAAGLIPERVSAYFRTPQKTQQSNIRRYNPATGAIE